MATLVIPFQRDRPIRAAICVERDTVRGTGPRTEIMAMVARNSAGDLWTLHYMFELPMGVTLFDSRRRISAAYHPGEPEPAVTPCHLDPSARPAAFPTEAPPEPPVFLSGIACYHRQSVGEHQVSDLWFSYEYAAYIRSMTWNEGYGTTTFYLDQVKLEEPPDDLFSESSILRAEPEYQKNLGKAASEVFRRMSEDGPCGP